MQNQGLRFPVFQVSMWGIHSRAEWKTTAKQKCKMLCTVPRISYTFYIKDKKSNVSYRSAYYQSHNIKSSVLLTKNTIIGRFFYLQRCMIWAYTWNCKQIYLHVIRLNSIFFFSLVLQKMYSNTDFIIIWFIVYDKDIVKKLFWYDVYPLIV